MAVGGLALLFALASLFVSPNERSFAQEKAKAPSAKDVKDVQLRECLVCVELSKIADQLKKLGRELDGIEKRAIANEKALQDLRDIVVRNAAVNQSLHAEQTKRIAEIRDEQLKESKVIDKMQKRIQSICYAAIGIKWINHGASIDPHTQAWYDYLAKNIDKELELAGLTNAACLDSGSILEKLGTKKQ